MVFSDMAVARTIAGPAGDITLRTFVPETVDGVYLHIHGGGWVLGTAHQQDPLLENLARSRNLAVLSVDYRLAPEDPYPAGPDDCEAAALWLVEHARAEYGTGRLTIGGESAGAHLAVVTLLRLRDKHQLQPFGAANLVFGVYDLSQTPSSVNAKDTLVIDQLAMKWFADHFVPPARRREPDVSPIFGELHGMPPAIFTVGTLDPLLDDTLFMYSRWVAAGHEAQLAVYPGGVHGFTGHPIGIARDAYDGIGRFLQAAS
jgi:acetyl esterase/lipase